jgi:hypothetical protein
MCPQEINPDSIPYPDCIKGTLEDSNGKRIVDLGAIALTKLQAARQSMEFGVTTFQCQMPGCSSICTAQVLGGVFEVLGIHNDRDPNKRKIAPTPPSSPDV